MNCNDYLAMLATRPVEELAYGHARDHSATCPDCDRVTRVVAEREHNMLMAFDGLGTSVAPAQTAAHALRESRRRTVALYYRIGLGVTVVGTVLFFTASRAVIVTPASPRVSETFRLQCLSPEQAAEVIRPHVQATGRVFIRPDSPLGVISVAASPDEMAAARSALDRYDNSAASQCAVQVTVPKAP